jgi:hypothetical protein
MEQLITQRRGHPEPWNKGKLVGQKAPLRLKEIWAIRIRLQHGERARELTLFNLAVDSKLRACDRMKLRVRDVTHGEHIAARAIVMQQKTQRPVQFEVTEQTRGDRPQPGRLWNPYTATHESLFDRSPNEESARRTAAPRPFEAREHRSIRTSAAHYRGFVHRTRTQTLRATPPIREPVRGTRFKTSRLSRLPCASMEDIRRPLVYLVGSTQTSP